MLRYLFALFCLFQATSSYAGCTAFIRPVSDIILPVTLPGPYAPLVTPISPWVSSTVTPLSDCGVGFPMYVRLHTYSPLSQTSGSFVDPEDGNTYQLTNYFINPQTSGIAFIVAAGIQGQPLKPLTIFNTATATYITPTSPTINVVYKVRAIRVGQIPNPPSTPMGAGGIYYLGTSWSSDFNNWATSAAYNIPLNPFNYSGTGGNFQTCTVLISDTQVTLPKIDANQLKSINSTTGDTTFYLPFYCPSPVNLYMTITDKSNPWQTSNIIGLTSDSSAKGIGIQIKRNNQPVYMGPDSSMPYNTNQFLAGTSANSVINLALSANYIRTGTVTGGSVKAITTFTLSYQ